MATSTLDLHPLVELATIGGGALLDPADGVYGAAADPWADASDASYARVSASLATGQSRAGASFTPLTGFDPARASDVTTTVRLLATGAAPTSPITVGVVSTLEDLDFTPLWSTNTPVPVGETLTISHSVSEFLPDFVDLIAARLFDPGRVAVWTEFIGGPRSLRVIEVSVVVTYTPVRRRFLTPHPTRRFPRDDGNGLTPTPRNYPPPRAARNYGGQN